jgi:hypothetical protein
MTLRFLLGLFGSPCLANGGASMGDIYSMLYFPYPLAVWVVAAFAVLELGPKHLCSLSYNVYNLARPPLWGMHLICSIRRTSSWPASIWLLGLCQKLAVVAVGDPLDVWPSILAVLFLPAGDTADYYPAASLGPSAQKDRKRPHQNTD